MKAALARSAISLWNCALKWPIHAFAQLLAIESTGHGVHLVMALVEHELDEGEMLLEDSGPLPS